MIYKTRLGTKCLIYNILFKFVIMKCKNIFSHVTLSDFQNVSFLVVPSKLKYCFFIIVRYLTSFLIIYKLKGVLNIFIFKNLCILF